MTKTKNLMMKNLIKERKQALEERYKELYSEGVKPNEILKRLSEESGLSKDHLYRIIEVKKCKFEVNKMGRLK